MKRLSILALGMIFAALAMAAPASDSLVVKFRGGASGYELFFGGKPYASLQALQQGNAAYKTVQLEGGALFRGFGNDFLLQKRIVKCENGSATFFFKQKLTAENASSLKNKLEGADWWSEFKPAIAADNSSVTFDCSSLWLNSNGG